MANYSSSKVAQKLGIPYPTLAHYIRVGKVPKPKSFSSGGMTVHVWSDADIELVRKLLPKIANGRKTRYQELREKQGTQPGAAALQKKRKTKKKK